MMDDSICLYARAFAFGAHTYANKKQVRGGDNRFHFFILILLLPMSLFLETVFYFKTENESESDSMLCFSF